MRFKDIVDEVMDNGFLNNPSLEEIRREFNRFLHEYGIELSYLEEEEIDLESEALTSLQEFTLDEEIDELVQVFIDDNDYRITFDEKGFREGLYTGELVVLFRNRVLCLQSELDPTDNTLKYICRKRLTRMDDLDGQTNIDLEDKLTYLASYYILRELFQNSRHKNDEQYRRYMLRYDEEWSRIRGTRTKPKFTLGDDF